MDDIKYKIDKEENEQLRSIPAQRLIEKLSLLKNRVDSAKKRWFWELLQNASDYNQSVNVKLVVDDDAAADARADGDEQRAAVPAERARVILRQRSDVGVVGHGDRCVGKELLQALPDGHAI